MALNRRQLIAAALSGVGVSMCRLAVAAPGARTDRRLVVIVLRGGMDGLWAVPAIGDPDFASARGELALYHQPPLQLDDLHALHPALDGLQRLYARQELAVLHAAGLPYAERSHFDAQQVLESGGSRPYQLHDGWLGRATAALGHPGMALTTAIPLLLRGPGQTDNWAPSRLPEPDADLTTRIQRLYADDPALQAAFDRAQALRMQTPMQPVAAEQDAATTLARKAADFLRPDRGSPVAVLELTGWDSHANLIAERGPYVRLLNTLQDSVLALREGLGGDAADGGVWRRTVVLAVTEFGRTVATNGTRGSDHGSGGVAFLAGGAVHGGRVIADWPGLSAGALYQQRDLRTTLDLRRVQATLLIDHLGLSRARVLRDIVPMPAAQAGAMDLLRA